VKLALYTDDLLAAPADLLAVGVFSDEPDRGLAFTSLNGATDGALERACRDEQFRGRPGQVVVFNVTSGLSARRITVVGLGERAAYGPEAQRRFAGSVARTARRVSAASCALVLTILEVPAAPGVITALVQAMAEGFVLGDYAFQQYKTRDPKPSPVRELHCAFAAEDVRGLRGAQLRDALARGKTLAEATAAARDLVNLPPNDLDPVALADRAKRMAKAADLKIEILGPRDMEKQGMGLFLGVARGSRREPRLIHLTYQPKEGRSKGPVIALVGKGLTFDAGGLSLKTAEGMLTMKCDMAGAAAVFGAMQAIAALAPQCTVHGLLAAAENMPDGDAIRPGDILRSKKGLTVEVHNTDAEGRLVLADAIAYALEQSPTDLIDVATLTGACMVALGSTMAGAWISDEAMAGELAAAWGRSGERFWRMPLDAEQREQLDSDVADLKNLGERWGGAITAALFLGAFVDGGVDRWAHLDIAGPVMASKDGPYTAKGGTGFGVRTLVEYVLARAADAD
jgi:leucyl aminopeptidase